MDASSRRYQDSPYALAARRSRGARGSRAPYSERISTPRPPTIGARRASEFRPAVVPRSGSISALITSSQGGLAQPGTFFAFASRVMRRVLIDHARERNCAKRGGAVLHVAADSAVILSPERLHEVVALDQALEELAQRDHRKSDVFETRFFGGVSAQDTAEALGIAPNTLIRDWDFARAWLRRPLEPRKPHSAIGSNAPVSRKR